LSKIEYQHLSKNKIDDNLPSTEHEEAKPTLKNVNDSKTLFDFGIENIEESLGILVFFR